MTNEELIGPFRESAVYLAFLFSTLLVHVALSLSFAATHTELGMCFPIGLGSMMLFSYWERLRGQSLRRRFTFSVLVGLVVAVVCFLTASTVRWLY